MLGTANSFPSIGSRLKPLCRQPQADSFALCILLFSCDYYHISGGLFFFDIPCLCIYKKSFLFETMPGKICCLGSVNNTEQRLNSIFRRRLKGANTLRNSPLTFPA